MPEQEYKLILTSVFDPNADVTFRIEPPVKFLTEEARGVFGRNVIDIIARRADYGELMDSAKSSKLELTHNTADGTATIGYARVPALHYGTGKEVFFQGLLHALNGRDPDLYENDEAIYPGFGDTWNAS